MVGGGEKKGMAAGEWIRLRNEKRKIIKEEKGKRTKIIVKKK